MSGETDDRVSGWTVDTLRSHFERVLAERDLRYQSQRADDKEAVKTALAANDRRLDGMNEFRKSLSDLESTLMPRSESTTRWESVSERVNELKSRVDAMVGENMGGAEVRRALLAIAAVLVASVGVGVAVVVAVLG